ncbi:(-)-isopiperitenol/(-)-carveol dehydrogenase, mitochondrial-like [Vigna unguiculata]|uniref:(-)-isopiperitenol/(-)-carveol dehydrogenase, mitochondrial-like n=1 Tax=Vigna unguiculata TaxID=3917 RepID=UPI001015F356|nr:(-)-isopiperitenol/(-)-carveol dehydrogenase, mitochondrial-like [Vigna unguiculata]
MEESTSITTTTALRLKNKIAIVTGGASGIGEATARLFAEEGARMVVIADIQDKLGKEVAASIGGERCSYFHCDVAEEDEVQSLVQSTVKAYGQLDIMFSNAGIGSLSKQTVVELDMSQLDKLFTVNVRGMAACVKHAARAMVEGRVRGSIVCTGSVAGCYGSPIGSDYVMSKHAVLGLMRSASMQLAEHGIRVNCVSPNGLATPLTCKLIGMNEEEAREVFRKFARLQGVVLTPKHVADAALFLVSDDSAFVTGLDLMVDGGYSL